MPSSRAAALVTGATGFIGRALVDRLLASGQHVVCISRRPNPPLPGNVEIRAADLASGTGIAAQLFDGVDRVFHCAGEIRKPEVMRAVHVDGTARLLRALSERRADRGVHWVQLSSVGAYGPPRPPAAPREVTEDTPENPAGDYETSKTESDRLVRRAGGDGLLSYTLVRPTAVIGPGMSNASLPGLIKLIRRGWFVHIGPDDALANYIHVDDVVRGLLQCSADPRAKGETFNMSSDCRWTELVERVAEVAGVAPPRRRVPASLARGVARLAGPLPLVPLSPARVDVLTSRTRYSMDKMRSRLGFELERPMPAALDEIIARC